MNDPRLGSRTAYGVSVKYGEFWKKEKEDYDENLNNQLLMWSLFIFWFLIINEGFIDLIDFIFWWSLSYWW